MMSPSKTITKQSIQQNVVISVITIITWLIAIFGWNQSFNIISDHSFYREQINIPSYFSTFLVLPLPYSAYLLFRHLLRQYPTIRWKELLDISIISALLLINFIQVLVAVLRFYLMLAGGGLDIILSWQTGIFFEAILYALPTIVPVTLINALFFLVFEEKKYAYWLLLPAIAINGITFFRLGFLFLGIQS